VTIPPMTNPNAPPIGAPAANVVKAMVRARDGGNEWARIPSYDELRTRDRIGMASTYRGWDCGGGAQALKRAKDIKSNTV